MTRTGLTRHPLDLRGSRRALEAAQIFLEVDTRSVHSYISRNIYLFYISKYLHTRSERLDFLNTTLRFKGQKTEGEENRGDLTWQILVYIQ